MKLKTHPGVGPLTALATVLTLGRQMVSLGRAGELLRTGADGLFQRRPAAAGRISKQGIRVCGFCWWKPGSRRYAMTPG